MSDGNASLEVSTSGEYFNLFTKKDWFLGWVNRLDEAGQTQDMTLEREIVPTVPQVVLYVCVVIIVVPGIAGNVLLFLLSRSADLSVHPYSLYLSTISTNDSVSLLYMYVDSFLQTNGLVPQLALPNLHWCRFVHTFSKTIITMSPWLLVCFSLDRYVALVFPLKRKTFCTFRNAKIMITLVLTLCLTTQAAISFNFSTLLFKGNVVCAVVTDGALTITQVEFGINMLVPLFALFFLNTHSLIAIKTGIAERMHLRRSAAGESAGVSRDDGERRRQDGDQGGARQQAGTGRGRTHGENRGPGDTDHDTPTGRSRAGNDWTAPTGLQSQDLETGDTRGQSTERHGEATGGEEGAHALDRETTGGQADRGEVATSGTEREPQDVEQGRLSQPGREQGLKADGSKDRARGPTSRGNGEDVGRGRNPGRRREDPANSQNEIRRMFRALLSIPLFRFLCMVPYAFVVTTIWFSMGVQSSRDIISGLQTVEPYLRVLFTMGYAANFYLLVGTSKRYRDIAWKVVRQRCGRRQD